MEFLQLRQYGMSVGEYASRFEFLLTSSWYFQLHPDEEWKCLKFEEGLRSEIREALLPLRIREFSRLVNECVLIEDRQKTRNEGQCHLGSSGSKRSDNVRFQQQLYAEPQGNEQQRRQSSGGNNKEAHHSTMSTFRYRNLRHGSGHANRKRNSKGIACFQGGKISQVASVCQQQPSKGVSGPSQAANLTQQSYAEPQGNEQQRQQSSGGNRKGARHSTVSTHRYYLRHGRGHANRNCNLKGIVGFQGGKIGKVASVCKQQSSKGGSGHSQAANLTPHCKRCGKGHLTRHCIIEGVACFKCGKPGHVWRDCMNNKRKRKVNQVQADDHIQEKCSRAVMVGLSLGEQHFIQGGIAQDLRCDGRKRLTYRPIYVETGVIPQANGSARVRMGATDVIASVKAELGKPSLLQPDKGKVSIHIDCSSTAEPVFEGRGGDELSAELSIALQRCLLGVKSGAGAGIDLSSLVVIEGKICWDLYIDGLVVSSDGNLLDALGAAIKAALSNTGIPRVHVAAGASNDEKPEVDVSDEEFLQFDTSGVPVIVTLTKVGKHYIVDATSEEESKMSSAVSLCVNRQRHICGITKRGGAGLDPSIILDMISVAKHVSDQLLDKLDSEIASAEVEDES